MIKLIVFDFDGTLADTKGLLLSLIKNNLGKFGYKITKEFIDDFGDKPLDGMLKMIGLQEKVLAFFVEEIDLAFVNHAKRVKACSGLQSLRAIEKKKIILSNSIEEFIKEALNHLKADFFDNILGADEFENKQKEFRKILRKENLDVKEVAYVGDRVIDVKLARKIGCWSIIVSNKSSWSSREDILNAGPDFIVDDLSEIKRVVEKI